MKKESYLITSESVAEGHPDKLCDQISDAVLDEVLRQDKNGRVACETYVTMGLIVVGGEITTSGYVDMHKLVRDLLYKIGYTGPQYGLDYKTCAILNAIHTQSPDIARGVNKGGAGDQGCLKKGTLVRTDRGFKPIEKIKPGDFVVTPYGLKKVLQTKKTGIKEIIELRFSNGMQLECTPNHKILCYNKKGQTYWQEAFNLTDRDFVCILRNNGYLSSSYLKSKILREQFFTKYNHKIYGPEEVILDEDTGYIMGLLIGDGYVKNKNLMEIAFGKEKEQALLVKQILDKKFPSQWRIIKSKKGGISLKIDSLLIRKHFENLGISYKKAPEKTTPAAIFTSPANIIKAYLRGLFDSDGTIVTKTGRGGKNIKVRLGSSSYRLLQETQLLLDGFRIKSSIVLNCPKGTPVGKDKRYKSNYDNFALSLVGFESYQNFAKEIASFHHLKNQKLKMYLKNTQIKPRNSRSIFLIPHPYKEEMMGEELRGKSLPFGITTIKTKFKKDKAEVYDLEISEKNIFSANGIFVHNSMIGYACSETPEFMPLPIMLAHKLVMRMADVRKRNVLNFLGPDGKSQVSVEYYNGKAKRVDSVVLACQHTEKILDRSKEHISQKARRQLIETIALPVLGKLVDQDTKFYVNETGKFVIGGPQSDTGMTGRKIVVDTYGGIISHGGGAFSGKDPTKVDRSAAYMARYIAKNIVASGIADRCCVQLAYVIGRPEPLAIYVDTYGTGKISSQQIIRLIKRHFSLIPRGIIEMLNLSRPIYLKTACYGHFGREGDGDFTWERTDKTEILRKEAKIDN